MLFRSCTISIVRSALTSHLNWATIIGTMVAGGGRGRASGRTDGSGQMSIEVRSSASVLYLPAWHISRHSAQTVTQSFVGNDAFRRSAGETSVYCSRRPTAQCPVLP